MERYMDSTLTPTERAEDLLSKLSLNEKMAQVTGCMAIPGREKDTAVFLKYGIGSLSTLFFRGLTSEKDVAAAQVCFQKMIMENSPHHIPAIFHMEGLCGSYVHGSTPFPSGINRGSAFDPALEEKIGAIVSRQENAYGITQILAPVLDVSRDPRMGRVSETYGEDPTVNAMMGAAFTKGIQNMVTDGRHTESTAKHFLGFHNSQGGIHGANADMGDRLIEEVYAKPFQAAIRNAHLRGIMPCYDSLNGLPIHASKKYLTSLLRNEMGFDGMVSSDYGAVSNVFSVQHVEETPALAGERCMAAGMDLELPMAGGFGEELKKRFENGEADISILDRAVKRVLEAKFRMGLFEHPFAMADGKRTDTAHHAEDEAVSLQAAQESIVLLKNDGSLPIKNEVRKIALIGPHATNARYYFGGYTHLSMVEADHAAKRSMAGVGAGGDISRIEMKRVPGTNIQDDDTPVFDSILTQLYSDCRSLLDTLKEQLPDAEIFWAKGYPKAGSDDSEFSQALALVEDADLVILTLGGKNGSGSIATMGEGVDGTNINLPACQDAFIKEAARYGKPMIGVHFDGRPISSDIADQYLNAIIEAWTPAKYAAPAVANVLTGAYNPSGKLTVSVARGAGQIPVYYNHPNGSAWHQGESIGFSDYVDMPHTPRYFFGHGLSYTEFTYSSLSVDKKETAPLSPVRISCHVQNTGKTAGTEVVQLYLSDVQASMTRPVQELQGFARVQLQSGEKKKVTFTVNPSQMAFLDEDMKWKIEKGEIRVRIGSSSNDIRLEDSFVISSDAWIEGKDRAFCAETEID